MREKISELIHDEWVIWAKTIIQTEPNISQERKERWQRDCFKPYSELSEEMKDLDRMFADKFIKELNL